MPANSGSNEILACDSSSILEVLFLGSKILQFPSTTAATAMAYFHKYCEVMKAKLPLTKRTDVIVLTSAILFLAGKSSENIRGTRGVLNVVRHLHGLSPESLELRQYQDLKSSVVESEHFLLRVLGFSMTVEVPHSHLLNIARYLRLSKREVMQSWMFLNDSLFDKKILTTSMASVACACIYLGIVSCKIDQKYLYQYPYSNGDRNNDKNHDRNNDGYNGKYHTSNRNDRYRNDEEKDGDKNMENKKNGNEDRWWGALGVKDEILFLAVDWISKISHTRIQELNNGR